MNRPLLFCMYICKSCYMFILCPCFFGILGFAYENTDSLLIKQKIHKNYFKNCVVQFEESTLLCFLKQISFLQFVYSNIFHAHILILFFHRVPKFIFIQIWMKINKKMHIKKIRFILS